MEAGMAAQRFYLAAEGSGLTVKFASAFADEALRSFLGLDKTGWEAVYSIAIGAKESHGSASGMELVEDETWRG